MRYNYRYDRGPLYMDRPIGTGRGIVASILSIIWFVVAFVAQLVVWAVLLVVGFFYTLVWLIMLPFRRTA